MKSVAQKILITLGCIALIALCVTPVFVDAQTTAASVTAGLNTATKASLSLVLWPIIISLYIFMSVIAALLGFSGLILDGIINLTIIDLSKNINAISAINATWKVIRDLANMSFIFILLYEGIRMVLGLGGTGIKKVVSGIIMAAILVNFSLFFTKVIIDASNIVTLGFYRSIVSAGTGTTGITTGLNAGLTGAYMSALKISSLYAPKNALETIFSGLPGVFILSANSVFLLITVFIFLAVTVMFVIRYIAFILLLIMSPVYFASMAVPGLSGFKTKFTETLISQALWGPVFMLLTWVMLTLAGDTNFLNLSPTQTLVGALTDPGKDTISVIINYIIIVGLLIQTLVLSKSVATKGGYVTGKMIDKGTSWVGGTVFGGSAAIGRNTIGAKANEWANDKDLRAKAASGDKWAQLKLKTYSGVASSSFDARRSMIAEDAQKRLGVDFGKGSLFNAKNTGDKGYAGKIEEKAKAEAAYVKKLKPSKEEEDAAKAEAQATIDSIGFKEAEAKRKKDVVDSPEYKTKVEAERKPLNDTVATTQAEKEVIDAEIKKSKEEIEELNKKVENLKDAVFEGAAEERKTAQEALKNKTEILKKTGEIAKEKLNAFSEAKEALKKFDDAEKKKQETWESDELKKLIAYAGGRKEGKGVSSIEASTVYQRRADAYATQFEEKATGAWFNRAWNGNPSLNIAIAKKIRAEAKSKTEEQQLAELARKVNVKERKEKVARGEKVDDEEDEAPKKPEPEEDKKDATT